MYFSYSYLHVSLYHLERVGEQSHAVTDEEDEDYVEGDARKHHLAPAQRDHLLRPGHVDARGVGHDRVAAAATASVSASPHHHHAPVLSRGQ